MEYVSTSIKTVIAKIIRDNGNRIPGHLMENMLEWIPEALEMLETTYTLMKCSTPSYGLQGAYWTKNYCVKLPCGLISILAVEDQWGTRIHRTGQQTAINSNTALGGVTQVAARTTDFETRVDGELNPVPWDGSNIAEVQYQSSEMTYDLKFNHLQTSEECAFVKIHYEALPVDKEGYPLIPDNANIREALGWWVRGKLVGQGWQDPIVPATLQGIEYCKTQFEHYAGRGLGNIKLPDQDRMARLHNSTVRLIPPEHFYDDFFMGSSQVQPIGFV